MSTSSAVGKSELNQPQASISDRRMTIVGKSEKHSPRSNWWTSYALAAPVDVGSLSENTSNWQWQATASGRSSSIFTWRSSFSGSQTSSSSQKAT
jgi:hypothetical protein